MMTKIGLKRPVNLDVLITVSLLLFKLGKKPNDIVYEGVKYGDSVTADYCIGVTPSPPSSASDNCIIIDCNREGAGCNAILLKRPQKFPEEVWRRWVTVAYVANTQTSADVETDTMYRLLNSLVNTRRNWMNMYQMVGLIYSLIFSDRYSFKVRKSLEKSSELVCEKPRVVVVREGKIKPHVDPLAKDMFEVTNADLILYLKKDRLVRVYGCPDRDLNMVEVADKLTSKEPNNRPWSISRNRRKIISPPNTKIPIKKIIDICKTVHG